GYRIGQLVVKQPDVLKLILGNENVAMLDGGHAVSITRTLPRDFSIEGNIQPAPEPGDVMSLRLKGLYQEYTLDLNVSPHGGFTILDPLNGLFILVLSNRGEIVKTQLISFKQGAAKARFTIERDKPSVRKQDIIEVRGNVSGQGSQ